MAGALSLLAALMPFRNRSNLLLLLTFLNPLVSFAHPIELSHIGVRLSRRALGDGSQENKDGGGISPQVWIPIIVVVLVLVGAIAMTWSKRSFFRGLAAIAAPTPTPIVNIREVTAEQLANGTARGDGSNETTTARTGPSRRPRRNRRTPSQISTKSLPAYNKEPGEEELVIFRGPQDMEDRTMELSTVVMPPVDERDADDSYATSTVNSQVSVYREHPDTPNSMPLLHNNDSQYNENDENENDLSLQNLIAPNLGQTQAGRSLDTMSNSDDTHSSMRAPSRLDTQDPRGEAPPYFEVIAPEEQQAAFSHQLSPNVSPEVPSSSPPSVTQPYVEHRRSGLRGLLHALSPSISRPAIPLRATRTSSNHTRDASDPSVMSVSTDASHGWRRPGSRSHINHALDSTNGLVVNASPFRDPSQSTTTVNSNHSRMNSPSLISVNSISAPLTHTLVRTEFTYPKSGPTPQQLKLISSRESFARFGLPYGPDAIAYAASTSRYELDRPPDFNAITGEGEAHGRKRSSSSLAAPAPTHRRTTSSGTTGPSDTTIPENSDATSPPTTNPSTTPYQSSPLSSTTPTSAPSTTSAPPPTDLAPPSSFRVVGDSRSQSRASSVQTFATAAEHMADPEIADSDAESSVRHSTSTMRRPSTPTTPPLSHRKDHTDATIMPGAVVVL